MSENLDELDEIVERYHSALGAFMTGDPKPALAIFSRRGEVTLANPFGPVARGFSEVQGAAERAAAHYRGGRAVGFETFAKLVGADFAYLVEVERYQAKVAGREDLNQIALRVTSVFHREPDGWKLLHRHADPITTVQAPESVLSGPPPPVRR